MRNFKCKFEYVILRLFQKILSKNRNKNGFLKNFLQNQRGFLQSQNNKLIGSASKRKITNVKKCIQLETLNIF